MLTPKRNYPTMVDMTVLIHNLYKGAAHPEVGYLDSLLPLKQIVKTFDFEVPYQVRKIESALFMSNLLAERGEFWHPTGMPFETWVKRMHPGGVEFDKRYNYFREAFLKGESDES